MRNIPILISFLLNIFLINKAYPEIHNFTLWSISFLMGIPLGLSLHQFGRNR